MVFNLTCAPRFSLSLSFGSEVRAFVFSPVQWILGKCCLRVALVFLVRRSSFFLPLVFSFDDFATGIGQHNQALCFSLCRTRHLPYSSASLRVCGQISSFAGLILSMKLEARLIFPAPIFAATTGLRSKL
jgi:hypothetical protein